MRMVFGSMLLALSPAASLAASTSSPPRPVLADPCAPSTDFRPPLTKVYHLKGGGTLVFVAVRHGDDPATRALLQDAFARDKPTDALVEGFAASRSMDPRYQERMVGYAQRRSASGHPDELATTIKLASDAGASFGGWDMSAAEDYAASVAQGFTLDDVIGAHLIRRHVNPFAGADGGALDSELRDARTVHGIEGFDYAAWYRRHYGDSFDDANGTPCGTGIGASIVAFETAERNRRLIAVLQAHVGPGKTVLIEAGANHWLALRPWLQSISDRVT